MGGGGGAHRHIFNFDAVNRLNQLRITDTGSAASNVTWNFTRNPASQILTETRSNDLYAWDGHVTVSRAYTANGLNQYTAAGGASFTYDANGNLTSDGTTSYVYDVENRLVTATAGGVTTTLRYDPLGRLHETVTPGGESIRFLWDGDALIAEYAVSGALLRRYVHGAAPGVDDPVAWYEGSSTGGSTWAGCSPSIRA